MPVATRTFRWTKAHSVNIAALDRQHQKLLDILHELHMALGRGDGNGALDPVLKKLADYATFHFAAEEALMETHDFPGLAAHRTEHDAFRKRMGLFLADHRAGKPGVPVSLLLFMQNWLKHHLQKTDREYGDFLNAHGVH